MDFGILPPEVNSGRMYSGPGPGPVLAAATAWAGLAAELELAAGSYQSVVSELAAGWAGPSATAMAAATAPYVTWMHSTAAVAGHTADQIHAAAAAFEVAFAMTVPPPIIAANRSLLLSLVATNFFGQNTAAIAATETAYAQMWAQDATAMYGYAGDAARATTLTPFTSPPETTNPLGELDDAAAVGRAVGNSAVTNTQQTLTKLSSTLHATAPAAAEATVPSGPLGGIASLDALPTNSAIGLALIPLHLGIDLFGAVVIDGLGVVAIDIPGAVGATLLKEIDAASRIPYVLATAASPGTTPITAGMGQAVPLSGLSVPSAWTTTAGEPGPAGAPRLAADARSASATSAGAARHSVNEMAMAGTAGLGVTAGLNNGRQQSGTQTARRSKTPRVPADAQLEISAEFRELVALHDAGILTDKEFAKEKERLFGS